ncbi:DciA family protein [Streptomyces sp. NPDC092307]|uniref:DciA family protein n=1 Tax=Streptomyces sp. NPDC092307 TaxID=3366013 RepID=UPI0037F69800
MTETTTQQQEQAAVAGELSGVDLARVALHQAREAAKARGEGGTRKAKRRTRTVPARGQGREPAGFAAVLKGLMDDRAWDVPTAGGSILEQWPAIAAAVAPQLPAHVQAVAFHAESGQLDLRPDSPAYATQLRLLGARVVSAANDIVGIIAVRTVRVLPVGAVPAPRTAPQDTVPAAAAPDVPAVPVKTREMASPGFHRALAAHQAVVPVSRVDPAIAEAVERQARVMQELRLRAFPEPEAVAEDKPIPIEQGRAERRRQAEVSHAAALRLARAERAAREAGSASDVRPSAALRDTA